MYKIENEHGVIKKARDDTDELQLNSEIGSITNKGRKSS